MPLTPRERVLTALDHKQPDRVPFDLGGSFVTTINVAAYARLRRALGLAEHWQLVREQSQSVLVDEDVRQALGVDTIGIFERAPHPEKEMPNAEGILVSEWGIPYRKAEGFGGHYTLVASPLQNATLAELENYPSPDPLAPKRFEGLAEQAAALRDGPYAVVGNLGWTEIFGMACSGSGMSSLAGPVIGNTLSRIVLPLVSK